MQAAHSGGSGGGEPSRAISLPALLSCVCRALGTSAIAPRPAAMADWLGSGSSALELAPYSAAQPTTSASAGQRCASLREAAVAACSRLLPTALSPPAHLPLSLQRSVPGPAGRHSRPATSTLSVGAPSGAGGGGGGWGGPSGDPDFSSPAWRQALQEADIDEFDGEGQWVLTHGKCALLRLFWWVLPCCPVCISPCPSSPPAPLRCPQRTGRRSGATRCAWLRRCARTACWATCWRWC